ncbi:MAG TPA: DUF222 domain-containing protein, partial [Actinomycetota bacterium]|nr:DUF222 domain-containing protein [Actinomycetota bacterium]
MGQLQDLSQVPLERLEHEISTLAAHIYAATCRWLRMIAEFDRREGWTTWGLTSTTEWLAWKCAISPRTAREHVRIARALDDLPRIAEAFAAGELSYSKVKALSRVANPDNEEELLGIALHATASQLDGLVTRYYRAAGDLDEANRRHRDRFVSWSYDEHGMLRIEARLDPEEGALVAAALESAIGATHHEPPEEGGPAGPQVGDDRSFVQRAADGLVMMAETFLQEGPAARAGGDRYQVVVHLDQGVIDEAVPRDRCHVEDGPALARETLLRLGCDAGVVTPDAGPKTRTIPTSTRRALRARDGGCRWPGCDRKRFVDAHHIRHWIHGGDHVLENLVQLCRVHHRMVHEGDFTIESAHDGAFTVKTPTGIPIPELSFLRVVGDGIEAQNENRDLSI